MPEAVLHTGAFNVLYRGSALEPWILGAIRHVQVVQEINVPASFSFSLTLAAENGGAQGAMLDTFAPGEDITILMGRDRLQRMIVGQVTAIEPRFATAVSTATIRGFDRMYRLRFGQKTRVFEGQGDDAIVQEVARSAGLNVRIEGSGATKINDYVKQQRESNYDFLLARAKQINHELLIDGTILVFRPSAEGAGPVRSMLFPKDLSRVDLDLRVPVAGGRVMVYGFNAATNEVIQAESQDPSRQDLMGGDVVGYEAADSFPDTGVIEDRTDVTTVEALQTIADARYQDGLEDFLNGTAVLTGDPALVAGVNIKLSGLSDRFDGIYYITGATHTYDDDTGYQTELVLRRTGI